MLARRRLRIPGELRRGWAEELDDAVRGLASGFLVGVPVVFTFDLWWLGDQTDPLGSLVLLGASYLLTLATIYGIGFHRRAPQGWRHLADATEALALAILALVVVFWALGQIGGGQEASIALGRIAVAVGPVSLGVAVANHLLPRDVRAVTKPQASSNRHAEPERAPWRRSLVELGAAAVGALFLTVSIVPVDDLNAIATSVPTGNLPVVILLSLLVTYSVVFAAGFAGESRRHLSSGPFQHPFVETVSAYLIALAVGFLVLWLFGRINSESEPFEMYNKVVLLGFPASMAAAAGRLVV